MGIIPVTAGGSILETQLALGLKMQWPFGAASNLMSMQVDPAAAVRTLQYDTSFERDVL